MSTQNFAFGFAAGVAEAEAHHEAVELVFGEGVGAFEFPWILGGDDEEGLRQDVGVAFDGYLAFAHGFEQCALIAGSCAIDFVGQQDVGEDGTWAKFEVAGRRPVDAGTEDITGKQVRCELHADEAAAKRFGDGAGERSFAEAGGVFEQDVAAGKECDDGEANGRGLSEDGGFDVGNDAADNFEAHGVLRQQGRQRRTSIDSTTTPGGTPL